VLGGLILAGSRDAQVRALQPRFEGALATLPVLTHRSARAPTCPVSGRSSAARGGALRAVNPPDLSLLASGEGPSATPDSSAPPGDAAPDAAPAGEAPDAGRISTVDSGPPNLCPERSDALFCDGFEDASFSRWSYYYLPSSSNVTTTFSTAVVSEIEPPYFGFSLVVGAARVEIGALDKLYPGTLAFPRDHWTCVELHVTIDPAQGLFEAYLDGQLAARSPAIDTQPDQGYTVLDAGIHYTDVAQGPVEVYVDDVVAGNLRVGCDS